MLKLTEIVILWVYYTIRFRSSLIRHSKGISFQVFELLRLTRDHGRGFSTRNAHMVHIVNLIRFKMVEVEVSVHTVMPVFIPTALCAVSVCV